MGAEGGVFVEVFGVDAAGEFDGVSFGDFGEGLFDLGGGEVVEHDGEGFRVGGGLEGLGFVFDFDFNEGRFGFCGF